jgi:hypothetical protein
MSRLGVIPKRAKKATPRWTTSVTVAALVWVQLAVRLAAVIIEQAVHPLIADSLPFLGAGGMPIAGDGVTGAGESGETVRIHMRQVSVTATRSGAPLPVARVGDATGQRAAMLATPWHGRAGLTRV